ncbi:MAG: class I SAM-dependent methyltransferase [Planctomycetes bacterium]|nr:class I SAM-dependent methyltransferase [Planctomycetota bacterium]
MVRSAAVVVCLLAVAACRGPAAVVGEDAAVAAKAGEASVKPGINKDFLDPALDVAKYEERFEGESREIFAQRAHIAGLLGLREGMAVADVGAGTGLFTMMFAGKVGAAGKVYAVDIAPKFVEHVAEVAAKRKLTNVEGVLCTDHSTMLPADSVDLVFVCDTYHHFEYPNATLASIHAALRAGGELVIVDFIREVGVSRPWILDHVRAGRDVVQREVEAAGFEFVRVEATPFLKENYQMRFRRR